MAHPILGIGVNDILIPLDSDNVLKKAYSVWRSMLERCYSERYQQIQPTYIGCSVCDEWKYFSKFVEFFENYYIEGYHLDKDILIRDNKVYSPQTCAFVPQEINCLLTRRQNDRGKLKQGVRYDSHPRLKSNKYVAQISVRGKRVNIGYYATEDEAFVAYKTRKEALIKEIATEYYNEGKIAENVYKALLRYEVRPTD